MINWIVSVLRTHPELAVFLTLAAGTLLGKLHYKSVSLGSVTGVLLAGVLVGQLGIAIPDVAKSLFFLLFLFAVGFNVGPQFFNSLKKDGLPQIIYAVIICVLCLVTGWITAVLFGFDVGLGSGLYAGGSTISAVIGVASDMINHLPLTDAEKQAQTGAIPIAYAVTYLFGTAGSAWILASLAPKILGIDFEKSCKELEAQMGAGAGDAAVVSAYEPLGYRAYRLDSPKIATGTVRELEAKFQPLRVFVERIRRDGNFIDATGGTTLAAGDVIAIGGAREALVRAEEFIGNEVDDPALLNFSTETIEAVVTNREIAGKSLRTIAETGVEKSARGIFVKKITRSGIELPVTAQTVLERGDVVTMTGAKRDIERAGKRIGYVDRPTDATDIFLVSLAILAGSYLGALTIHVGGVPISLSTSGGALVAGLIFGWLRSRNQRMGRIPAPALWVFNNVGLAVFIAIVGINAGPGFVAGLKTSGLQLLFAGIIVTTVPLILGLLIGKWFFKMHPVILIGACAGARTTTAALGAIQEAGKSKVPALGYTVTYAVGNTLLIIWGVVIVLLLK